ncbi:MAG TPA: glycosyltransferase [Lacunisphaera sp.]|nr:glycosyltransferase [Lacunisphaera sp.]
MIKPRCSLVIPFYQEARSVSAVVPAACAVLERLDPGYEAILVNDGSTDDTGPELDRLAAADPHCRVLSLPRNQGQAVALYTGLRQSRGEIILTMDGDGQDDPQDFPALLSLLEQQKLDVACGWRRDRHDSVLRRAMSGLANAVRSRVLHDGLHDAGCQLRVFRRAVIATLQPSPLMQSFLPAMAVAAGLRAGELPVHHHPRLQGESKYGFAKLWWRPFREMLRLRRVLAHADPPR